MPAGPGLWSSKGKASSAAAAAGAAAGAKAGAAAQLADLGGFELDFGAAPPKKRTWRDSALSDWELRLGERSYRVHRTILAQGERMSHFFLAQFQHWDASGCTDLASLLPEACWPAFEATLDYVYEGSVELDAANVVQVLKIAHVLQIPTLGETSTEYLKAHLSRDTAPAILAAALELSPGFEALVSECMRVVAREFDTYAVEEFGIFPAETMFALLRHPQLWASPKHVSHSVAAYIRAVDKGIAQGERGSLRAIFDKFAPYVLDVQAEDAIFLLAKAVELGHAECRAACMRCVVQHFALVDVRELAVVPDHATVVEILDNDELATNDEDQILEVIMQYINAKKGCLSDTEVGEVLATCRFADLSLTAWESVLSLEQVPVRWLKLGMMARLLRSEQGQAEYEAFVARQGCADVLVGKRLHRRKRQHELFFLHFSSPFDTNGVLYWIGTHGRTRKYENPCDSGDVTVTFSKKGTGREAYFVQHANSAQDCHTDDMEESWMQVDLGPTRSLRANHYCLRHGLRLNEYCLRNWELQGSNDGCSWTTLHERVNDSSLIGGGFTTAAWPIDAPSRASYRLFRIFQTGPSHSTCSDNLRVACAGIELYGDLFQEK